MAEEQRPEVQAFDALRDERTGWETLSPYQIARIFWLAGMDYERANPATLAVPELPLGLGAVLRDRPGFFYTRVAVDLWRSAGTLLTDSQLMPAWEAGNLTVVSNGEES